MQSRSTLYNHAVAMTVAVVDVVLEYSCISGYMMLRILEYGHVYTVLYTYGRRRGTAVSVHLDPDRQKYIQSY